MTERMTANRSAPSKLLKNPETFVFTLTFLMTLSVPLLSGGTSLWYKKVKIDCLFFLQSFDKCLYFFIVRNA